MIRTGAYWNGQDLYWVAIKEKVNEHSLLGHEKISAPSIEYAVAAISIIAKNYKIGRSEIVFSIPTHMVYADIKQFAALPAGEKGFEQGASKAIPGSYETTVLSFQTYQGEEGQRVLFGNAEQKIIDHINNQRNRLNAASLTVEFSLVSLLRTWKIEEPSVVLHVDRGELLLVLFDPAPYFIYSSEVKFKDEKKITAREISLINGELRRAINYAKSIADKPKPGHVFLSGLYQDELYEGLKVSIPLGRIVYTIDKPLDLGSEFATVLGAALRERNSEFNFLYSPRSKSKRLLWIIVIALVTAALIGGAAILLLNGS